MDSNLQQQLRGLYEKMVREGNRHTGRYIKVTFPYVTVPSQEIPQSVRKHRTGFGWTNATNEETQALGISAAFGDATLYQKLCKKGKRLIFVVSDQVPKELWNPVAAHEYVEGYYEPLGRDLAHMEGIRAEFEQARRTGTEFFRRYAHWWKHINQERLQHATLDEIEGLKSVLPPEAFRIMLVPPYNF